MPPGTATAPAASTPRKHPCRVTLSALLGLTPIDQGPLTTKPFTVTSSELMTRPLEPERLAPETTILSTASIAPSATVLGEAPVCEKPSTVTGSLRPGSGIVGAIVQTPDPSQPGSAPGIAKSIVSGPVLPFASLIA